ncbi:MAG: transposase [Acidobacteria bacterium]|nr:transposase [Acidobacteriota bacterium]
MPPRPARRHASTIPYPYPRATTPGDLQQTDFVGPRYVRGPSGATRFYSIHTIAIVGRGIAATQVRYKTADALCLHFVAAWTQLGVPRVSQIDNEMAATGGGRHAFGLSLVTRLHLLCAVHLVFLPHGEPGRNPFVESFNYGWQARVLIHPCADLAAVRRTSASYARFYHDRKPHRALTVRDDGTRFPGEWLRLHQHVLHWLPPTFTLDAYRNRRGALAMPVAGGRVSWIQKVDTAGHIAINARPYSVGKRLTGQYVQATLFTHQQRLVVYTTQRQRVKAFPFPITEPVIAPILPRRS